jgi:hypothetical protein
MGILDNARYAEMGKKAEVSHLTKAVLEQAAPHIEKAAIRKYAPVIEDMAVKNTLSRLAETLAEREPTAYQSQGVGLSQLNLQKGYM